jgi:hypothetical protein
MQLIEILDTINPRDKWPRKESESLHVYAGRLNRNIRRYNAIVSIDKLRKSTRTSQWADFSTALIDFWESASGMSIDYEI